jgi:SOS regulatory protein LexA
MALTKRQKEVLNYLVGFLNKNGYSPSFEEIAHALKLTSLATVHKHLSTLEKKGFIRRGYNQSRSIEVTQLPKPVREEILDRHVVELPLAGRIAAGRPLEAVEDRETISLADFARGQNTFVLQVKGESMRDDHILDGDYIVVEQTQVANPGEIVVALVGAAAEMASAFSGAWKNRLDLSVGIALGSAAQIALFVAPVLVLLSYVLGPSPMSLQFWPGAVVMMHIATLTAFLVTNGGRSAWFPGVLVSMVYLLFAITLYLLPPSLA